jgi:hypothetical protein
MASIPFPARACSAKLTDDFFSSNFASDIARRFRRSGAPHQRCGHPGPARPTPIAHAESVPILLTSRRPGHRALRHVLRRSASSTTDHDVHWYS